MLVNRQTIRREAGKKRIHFFRTAAPAAQVPSVGTTANATREIQIYPVFPRALYVKGSCVECLPGLASPLC